MASAPPPFSFTKSRLSRRLWLGALLAISLSSAVAVVSLLDLYKTLGQTRHDARLLHEFYLVLETSNHISAERGPSNIVMGSPASPSALSRLQVFRSQTDAALGKLNREIIPPAILDKAKQYLGTARRQVDNAATRPVVDPRNIKAGIEAMFSVYDAFQEVVEWHAKNLVHSEPALLGPVQHALTLSDLRDSAGRLGSYVVPYLISGKQIPLSDLQRINDIQKRIALQWQRLQLERNPEEDLARQSFEGYGLPLVANLISEGQLGKTYSLDERDFTLRYTAALAPLEKSRSNYLRNTVEKYEICERKAARQFVGVLACTVCIVGLIYWIIVVVRTRVLKPLLDVSASLVALVNEQPLSSRLDRTGPKEMDELFKALDAVEIGLRERAELTERFKQQAETDPLTHLMNRRAFEAEGKASLKVLRGACAFLMLLDLDHFKLINDCHGHPTGDRVLVAVAEVLRNMVRPRELIARIGGEEFAILIQAQDLPAAISTAESIQAALRKLEFTAKDGTPIRVAASIGISEGGEYNLTEMLSRADLALYDAKRAGRNCIKVFNTAVV
ncbi:GGDEF domain-containing protein [Robbsia andropogonis]|nr:GGDEF domain-containing protein [Robbsia andropogonis]